MEGKRGGGEEKGEEDGGTPSLLITLACQSGDTGVYSFLRCFGGEEEAKKGQGGPR